ncbi:MAG: DUF4331 family protein [Alphaproteobacteria bacterium]|nr:DUF4331 family protein [Alphaproteobacteria bacterium]
MTRKPNGSGAQDEKRPFFLMRNIALAISAVALLSGAPPALAADHRDSPSVDEDITTDINDVFMFRDPADATKLVLVMTTHPLSDPKFASSYHYNSNALYRFNLHTNTTAVPTSSIDFTFSPTTTDASGKQQQTFTAYLPHGVTVTGPVTMGSTTSPTPPTPIVTSSPGGIQIYAGPREDPFVFDLVGFNRFAAGLTPNFTGNNAFAGFNVNAIVIELPTAMVVGSAQKFGMWGTTFTAGSSRAQLTQIDRMGNPAINTALIPTGLKDAFNAGIPQNDARDFAPTILKTLSAFNTPPANVAILASVGVPDTLKIDLSKPDGFPNGRRLQDRVLDIEIQLISGNSSFTDGTGPQQAAKVYLTTFPYLGPPCQATPTAGTAAPGDCAATAMVSSP